MLKNYFATGRCLCGQVTFSIASKPLKMGQCHCDDCQRSTGTGHASNVFFNKKQVNIEGKLSTYDSTADSGAILSRSFCPECGSRLFVENKETDNVIGISAGVLDDNSWFKADFIVYNNSKPAWDCMDESIVTFAKMPNNDG
jgi:hypothetical protein